MAREKNSGKIQSVDRALNILEIISDAEDGLTLAQLSEEVGFAYWLTGGNKAHDIAFVEYERPNTIHHHAFYLEDWNAIGHAADLIGKNRVKRDVGPTRHAITRGQTIYFFEPSGNRIETYAGGYAAYPDNPKRTWTVDEIGRGLFYYEGELFPSFLEVVT